MIKTQTRNIDGNTFGVTQLTARRAMRMFHRLGRILGPALAPLAEGAKGGLGNLNAAFLGQAVGVLFDRCDAAEFDEITKELLETATIDGKMLWGPFDLLMQGRIP